MLPIRFGLRFDLIPSCPGGGTMLDSGKMIGFVGTSDYDRARAFYEGKLGCQILSSDQFAMVARLGENTIRIVNIPHFIPVKYTVLGWEVENVEAAVQWLRQKGVELERYPWIQDQESGIWTTPNGDKVAWFKDPDGNVLSVSHHV